MKPKMILLFVFTVIILFEVNSCNDFGRANNKLDNESPNDPNIIKTEKPQINVRGTDISEIPQTQTPIIALNITTSTISPTITLITSSPNPTLTPIPSIKKEEKKEVIEKLLSDDYLCTLPCYGSIKPGITEMSQIKNFIGSLSDKVFSPRYTLYTAYVPPPEKLDSRDYVIITFIGNSEGKVELIQTLRYNYPIYELFQNYGVPSEILFFESNYQQIDPNGYFEFYIVYKEHGVLAIFEGINEKGEMLDICPEKLREPLYGASLWLWNPQDEITFPEMLFKHSGITSLESYNPIEDIFDLTIMEFYKSILNNPDSCFQIRNPNLSASEK